MRYKYSYLLVFSRRTWIIFGDPNTELGMANLLVSAISDKQDWFHAGLNANTDRTTLKYQTHSHIAQQNNEFKLNAK